ncbi:hypothetical protein [Flavobacterium adhaerens]|uniref:hypothetical protein n=1 Tax=Flavobacterium adhaerens TaxID=3149043 RepID=UPI0032B4FFA7
MKWNSIEFGYSNFFCHSELALSFRTRFGILKKLGLSEHVWVNSAFVIPTTSVIPNLFRNLNEIGL